MQKEVKLSRRSLYSLWRSLLDLGYEPGGYETFLKWVHRVEDEAVRKGYLKVRKGKRKSYIIKDAEGLLNLMCELGYAL